MLESRTATAFRGIIWGGTENIVSEDMTPNTAGTLVAGYAKCYNDNPFERGYAVRQQYAVRRLMPIECERLQGLPDNYTLIDDKTCSDSARYKALGNGMCQNCADFVIRRIVEEVEKQNDGNMETNTNSKV